MKNLLQRFLSAVTVLAMLFALVPVLPFYVSAVDAEIDTGDNEAEVVEVSLQQLVMAIDANWENLTDAQKTAVAALYSAFEQTMVNWDIPNIKG